MTKIALVDMDGVLADWMGGLTKILRELCDERGVAFPFTGEQKSWKLLTGDPDADDIIEMAQKHPELYLNLPALPGSKLGLKGLEALGYDVFICSTPSSKNDNCASHKYQWVRSNLGEEYVDKTILTADKTLVFGDILIDDKPKITGAIKPSWEHVVFDAPYNKGTEGRRLNNWSEVIMVIGEELVR